MKRISGNADDIKDKKDRVKKDGYNRGQHCIYCLTYHMIFVTHYRKPVINEEMSSAMKEFSNHMAEQFRGKILSAETDRDHIHLLVSLPPNTNVSVFVRSIKTQLSREMRKRFPEQIKQYIYGDDTSFWSRSYFIATTGSVSLETLKQYIESQRSEEHQAKRGSKFQKKICWNDVWFVYNRRIHPAYVLANGQGFLR